MTALEQLEGGNLGNVLPLRIELKLSEIVGVLRQAVQKRLLRVEWI